MNQVSYTSPYNRLGIRGLPQEVRIFDTTLRDGEQAPGMSMTPDDKLTVAKLLDELGVDCIEAGFAASSEADRQALKMIVSEGLKADIYGLARCTKGDIDATLECGIRHVHLFIATSDTHLKYKLHKTREQVLDLIRESVSYACSKGRDVMFSCEDATRTDLDYLLQAIHAAVDSGASVINIPDTVGAIVPSGMYELVSTLKREVDVPISVHCHNDLGLAVANALASAEAGAEMVHTCINGIGERTGNTSTEEFALNLHLNYGLETLDLSKVERTCRMVAKYTGFPIAYNKPLVGKNAFSHEAGIHVHGVLANSSTYEVYPPELVGRTRNIAIGRHSGIHSVKEKLDKLKISFPDDLLVPLMKEVKTISAGEREITDIEFAAIAENILWQGGTEEIVKLTEFTVLTGKNVTPTATVTLEINGERTTCARTGIGPVDATVSAIKAALDDGICFEELRLESITGGSDALCEVTVLTRNVKGDGNVSAGKAVGLDIIDTTVDAIMQAINRDYARKA